VNDYITEPYIREALTSYVNTHKDTRSQYTQSQYKQSQYKLNTEAQQLNFSIDKFDYRAVHLEGNYEDFYEYTDNVETTYIFSPNEAKLRVFCAWLNRITC
jgi:hypothetical protein